MRQGNDVLVAQYCPRYGPMVVVNNSFRGGERDLQCLDMKNHIRSHRQLYRSRKCENTLPVSGTKDLQRHADGLI